MEKKKSHGHDFIKFILQSTIEDKKLTIPPKFVMKFGDTLSDSAELALSNGCTWRLGLKKENRTVCFEENWHEFVELHLIRPGFMLLFSYKGKSSFDVVIFDHSYCGTHRHRKIDVPTTVRVKEEVEESTGFGCSDAVEAATVFVPQKVSLKVVLKQYNLRYMYVGTESGCCLSGVVDSVKFVSPQGRRWVVKFMRKPNNSLLSISGWRTFCRDNDLKVGDVCVFEAIEGKSDEVKVTVSMKRRYRHSYDVKEL